MATGVCNVRDACRGAASGVIVHVVGAMCCASADQGHGALGGWAVYVLSFILRLWFGLERPKKKSEEQWERCVGRMERASIGRL